MSSKILKYKIYPRFFSMENKNNELRSQINLNKILEIVYSSVSYPKL